MNLQEVTSKADRSECQQRRLSDSSLLTHGSQVSRGIQDRLLKAAKGGSLSFRPDLDELSFSPNPQRDIYLSSVDELYAPDISMSQVLEGLCFSGHLRKFSNGHDSYFFKVEEEISQRDIDSAVSREPVGRSLFMQFFSEVSTALRDVVGKLYSKIIGQ